MSASKTTPPRASARVSPVNTPESSSRSNPAKQSFVLLNLFEQMKNVSTALGEFKSTHHMHISETAIKHLEVMEHSLRLIYSAGMKQTGIVSSVKHLQKSFILKRNADKKRKTEDPMERLPRLAVHGLREFAKRMKKGESEEARKASAPPLPMISYEEPRRSARGSPTTTPSALNLDDFTGLPPQGARLWTKESLVWFVDNLVTSGQKVCPFTSEIVAKGKNSYKDESSIRKLHRKWKKTGVFRNAGRHPAMPVDEVRSATNNTLNNRSHDSNTFGLQHMKDMIVQQKKEVAAAVGLNPHTTKCSVLITFCSAIK